MANNYVLSSSFLKLSEEQISQAQNIIDQVVKELEESDEEYCGCSADLEKAGVWFHGEESINIEHVEKIAKKLIDQLEVEAPFCCSWAYTCDKDRLDEFGGGAFVVQRDKETHWVDAMSLVQEFANR